MIESPNPIPAENTPAGQEPPPGQNRRDFWLGLIGSIVGNLLLSLCMGGMIFLAAMPVFQDMGNTLTGVLNLIIGSVPWMLNLAALALALLRRRPYIALGILASYAVGFCLALLAGVVFMAICFTGLGY